MRRPRLVAITLTLVGIAASAGAWLGWERARSATPPAPFDEARDLPPLPADAENGWLEIAHAPASTFEHTIELPRFVTDDGLPDVDAALAQREALDAWDVPDETVACLDRALARPRFVIACPFTPTSACEHDETLSAFRVALALVLRDVLDGDDARGLARLTRLVEASNDMIRSGRTLVDVELGVVIANLSIGLASVVGATIGARVDAPPPALRSDVDALEIALRALDPASWSIEAGVMGNAIRERRVLESAGESADTLRAADAYWIGVLAYARDPARAPRPEDDESVPIVRLDPATLIDHFTESARRDIDRIDAAHVALAAARARIDGP